jgi:RND superfamily putative drug exporter
VAAAATLLTLVFLPALLSVLGARLERERLAVRGHLSAFPTPPWRRLARAVLARRRVVCAVVTIVLILLAMPFRRLRPSRSDVRSLTAAEEPRRAVEQLNRDFPTVTLTPLMLVVAMPDDVADEDQLAALYDYTRRLERLPSVTRVESLLYFAGVHDRAAAARLAPVVERVSGQRSARGRALASIVNGRYTLVRVISPAAPDSPEGQALVRAVRAVAAPPGGRVLVYGQAAALRDFADSLTHRAPIMLLFVAVAMFAVLYRAFGSAVLPLKAMAMTALSLTASFGAIVYIFQDGRLQGLLRYEARGTIDATLPIVMFAVVFGLSMDYEVVILSRIREAYRHTRDNDAAIVAGLEQTGGLITGAAALMIVVFSAFATAPVVFVKAVGLGMALAVALDASIVRLLLVPSAMGLLGRLNWWPHDTDKT